MNGQVWCESEHGKGATFIVELPEALASEQEGVNTHAPLQNGHAHK
jgi:hypothetical protein